MSRKSESCVRYLGATRLPLARISAAAGLIAMHCSAHSQTPADDLAAQVRSQGYQCDRPISATQDAKLSKPDSAVWVLKCANAAYQVGLDPDMTARVIKLH